MTEYCSSEGNGKVVFSDKNGIKQNIDVPSAFTISCAASINPCGRAGIRSITYTVANPATPSVASFSGSSWKDEVWFFKTYSTPGTWDGYSRDLYGLCDGVERLIVQPFSINSGAVTIQINTFAPDDSEGLIIKDLSGKVLFNLAAKNCDYEIICGDNCPQGSHKCTHNKYPGYCCVPCKETGDRLKNIANKVGR